MKVNTVIIAIVIIAILAFFYFIIKRNKKDQKELENELSQNEVKPDSHTDEHL
jgi:preprotein translocase subunit YajC